MKSLFLVRHAKSSWDYPHLEDHQRPLAARGKRDAPRMARILVNQGIRPDKLISSPAQRAHDTAMLFAKEMAIDHWDILIEKDIYDALPDTLQEVTSCLNEDWSTVALFGHNPGFTVYANRFTEGFRFDNIPTCGIVRIDSDTSYWTDFVPGHAKVMKWYFPKDCLD